MHPSHVSVTPANFGDRYVMATDPGFPSLRSFLELSIVRTVPRIGLTNISGATVPHRVLCTVYLMLCLLDASDGPHALWSPA